MSSAKRTPRYVDAIIPFEVVERNAMADVIRLRPEPLGPALPPITEQWPRRKAVPLARRPWQLLLVPPTPGAATRSFNVARWQARLVLGFAAFVLLVAGAGTTALVLALRAPDLFATSAEAALLRERLTVVEDSLALARTELEAPDDSLAASSALASAGAPAAHVAARPPAPASRATRRSTRSASAGDDAELTTRGIQGLPVIGAIASRFSRARRHPILHIIRPHLGIDVAAARGTKIVAPAPGRVSFVGRKFGFGLVVEIDHGSGVTTRYAHCGTALVSAGAHVERGVAIATVGMSGLSTGPHLHYEVLVHGHQVDPLRYKLPQPADSAAARAAAQPIVTPAAVGPAAPAPVTIAPVATQPPPASSASAARP
ncbi:MAG TPA: M23 family metallopeptidase [Gemmatimonadaceae bacterium]|jgi:murein DD-endopeptidase MepM/ murein hydrolase activator NlpD|nr:M23 family metallopeptidase [Gemmatimonadaceae bacterium]